MKFNFDTDGPMAALLIGDAWPIQGCTRKPGDADVEKALAIHAA